MSKWRPNEAGNLYVIPDIHGMLNQLELILSRIIPLRFSANKIDKLIFLGDYIDRSIDSHAVIDMLIELKRTYKDQVIFLKGNHEMMFSKVLSETSIQSFDGLNNYLMWMRNGGEQTLLGYLDRQNMNIDNPYKIKRDRIPDIIPKAHISFFNELRNFYETENYIFVHGGCDPFKKLNEQSPEIITWDRSLFKHVKMLKDFKMRCSWSKMIVTGHNTRKNGEPFVYDKFMMIDSSSHNKLNVIELNTMRGFCAKKNKARLVKVKC